MPDQMMFKSSVVESSEIRQGAAESRIKCAATARLDARPVSFLWTVTPGVGGAYASGDSDQNDNLHAAVTQLVVRSLSSTLSNMHHARVH
jgi:hypothetical protein